MSKTPAHELEAAFRAECRRRHRRVQHPGKWGHVMVERPIQSGYRGAIYPRKSQGERPSSACGPIRASWTRPTPSTWPSSPFRRPRSRIALRQCARKGVKAAIVISAGFAETGPHGKALQDEVVGIARQGGIRIMGPNGMGMWSSAVRLNTAFRFMPTPGGISFVSQSGTMGGYLLETATNKGYGFNAFLSVGNQADLSMADYIDYLGNDPATSVIVLYIEGLKDGDRFIRTVREVIRKKPIIAYKAGTHRKRVPRHPEPHGVHSRGRRDLRGGVPPDRDHPHLRRDPRL